MKVGDKVRLAHFHGSTGDQVLAESGAAGVIKSIEEEPEPNVLTRCVEVQWSDGISWHFRHRLILEEHPPDCPWHKDWHACNCGLFENKEDEEIKHDRVHKDIGNARPARVHRRMKNNS